MFNIFKRLNTRSIRESPKLMICRSSSSFSLQRHNSYEYSPWFSHKSTQAMCLWLCTFQSKTPRYKAISGQHSLRKDAIALSRGAYSAGALSALMPHAYVMYAPWCSRLVPQLRQLRKISGTSIKSFRK